MNFLSRPLPPPHHFSYNMVASSTRASLVAQMVKNLPAMQETQIRSLGWEDYLEKGMATQFSILAWRIPWTEEPGGLYICLLAFLLVD